jgi:iron(III) transport system substrate-binding protein
LRLRKAGILETYKSHAAASIPDEFKDPEGYWTGFAARARVLIVNTDLVKPQDMPRGLADLAHPRWKGKVGMARPLAGTGLTHFAILFENWGDARTIEYCNRLVANDINLAAGNAHVAQRVGRGQLAFGLVDSDDFEAEKRDGKPVAVVYPDATGEGTLLIPNTLSLVRGGPHTDNARKLIDALLDPAVERKLAFSDSRNIPVRASVEAPPGVVRIPELRRMPAPFERVADRYDGRLEQLKSLFLK